MDGPVEGPVEGPIEGPVGEPVGGTDSTRGSDQDGPPQPPKGTGIFGRVVDGLTGEGIIEGQVVVVGRRDRAVTDLDGYFRLELPPGTYTVRSFYEFYDAARLEDIAVRDGTYTEVTLELTPQAGDTLLDEVVVTAKADTSTEATLLQVRRESTAVRDAVSAQEIARTGDSTASGAVRRVVGASIDNNFLVVRGLGGRYTNVLLNGVAIPSTDPDVPGVELDLFPTSSLSSIAIVKTFTADLPANFSGGSMQISTQSFPDEFLLSVGLSGGYNSQTTLRSMLDYEGGSLDFLGFDDGTRASPNLPGQRIEVARNSPFSFEDTEIAGRAFPNIWQFERRRALPKFGGNLAVGDTVTFGERRLGYLLSFGYDFEPVRNTGVSRSDPSITEEGEVRGLTDLTYETGGQDVLWGGLGTATLELSEDSEVSLLAMWNQSASDETRRLRGETRRSDQGIQDEWQLRFIERSLLFTQLFGEHRNLGLPPKSRLRWNLNVAQGTRTEPDTRSVLYIDQGFGLRWSEKTNSGERLGNDLNQLDYGGGADYTIPIGRSELQFGGRASASRREFTGRRFRFFRAPGVPSEEVYEAPIEDIFGPESIGTLVRFREVTRDNDGYDATQRLYAAFGQVNVPIGGGLRAHAGVRAEAFQQDVESASPLEEDRVRDTTRTDATQVDYLPGLGLTQQIGEDMYVRLAYGATVARPSIRELAPFAFFDFLRRRTIAGNPDLERTLIHNVDLRWELFPSLTEVIAVSLFYKKFVDPIELVILTNTGDATFQNAESARNLGVEFETRFGLGHLHKSLEHFSMGGNLSLLSSRVNLSEEQAGFVTNQNRALFGQSPYVANLSLRFSEPATGITVNLAYNVAGPRITEVGTLLGENGLPDIKEQPFHQLDWVISWQAGEHVRLKLSWKNMLFDTREYRQGNLLVLSEQPGTDVSVGATFSY